MSKKELIRRDIFLSKVQHTLVTNIAESEGRSFTKQLSIIVRDWLESQNKTIQSESTPKVDNTKQIAEINPISQSMYDKCIAMINNTDMDFEIDVRNTYDFIKNNSQLTEKQKNMLVLILNSPKK